MAEPDAKRFKKDSLVERAQAVVNSTTIVSAPTEGRCICTHHGSFHCDEVLACSMLKLLPMYQDLPIVRTRNEEHIAEGTVVVDVGGVYDPERLRFDHHQPEFQEEYRVDEEDTPIKLSSAGLVYRHFSLDIFREIVGPSAAESDLAVLHRKVYKGLIREVDAIDNGVTAAEELVYRIHTDLSSRVGRLNPSWREPADPASENERFRQAMRMATSEFVDRVQSLWEDWFPARNFVVQALEGAKDVDPSGKIAILPQYCPWKSHLEDLEKERAEQAAAEGKAAPPLLVYMIYQDTRGQWRVQAVAVESGSFESRKPLPSSWRGLRGDELSERTGIPGCVFVHMAGFIGGNQTQEGAIAMAKAALESEE